MRRALPAAAILAACAKAAPPPAPQDASATGRDERARIEALLAAVERSGVLFERSGTEYDAKAAAAHLRRKWSRAGGRELTAEEFIEKVASRSSMTGRPYRVKLENGTLVPAAGWLGERLAEIDAADGAGLRPPVSGR